MRGTRGCMRGTRRCDRRCIRGRMCIKGYVKVVSEDVSEDMVVRECLFERARRNAHHISSVSLDYIL